MAKKVKNIDPTISEIRTVLKAILLKLKSRAATIPDSGVRRAKLAKLDAIAHAIAVESHQTDDVTELLDYAIRAIAIMKCSVEAAKFSLQAPLVDLALDGLLNSDDEELRKVANIRTI